VKLTATHLVEDLLVEVPAGVDVLAGRHHEVAAPHVLLDPELHVHKRE
jgi:hypothetical protein